MFHLLGNKTRRQGDKETRRQQWFFSLSPCLLVSLSLLLAQQADPDEPPVADQPTDFNGAIGHKFQVSMSVDPAEVQVGNPLKLTLRVHAVGPWKRPPKRPRLGELECFKMRFQVERPDKKLENQADRTSKQTWEFDYRLRALSESVNEVPPFAFVYYRPSGSPSIPGSYQSPWTKEVPLLVKPRVETEKETQPPIRAPSQVFQIAEGPAVLRRDRVASLPSLPVLGLLLLLPPLAGLAWFIVWRRLFPNSAWRARKRQSGAARQALHALQALAPAHADQRAYRVARIAAGYLHQRLGLPTVEPTPAEVGQYLERVGSPPPLAGKAAEFFRACDAARFAPVPAAADDLAVAAKNLILTLEAEPWPGM